MFHNLLSSKLPYLDIELQENFVMVNISVFTQKNQAKYIPSRKEPSRLASISNSKSPLEIRDHNQCILHWKSKGRFMEQMEDHFNDKKWII